MHNHAPENYICPICVAIEGFEDERTLIRQTDIVYQDDIATAFIGSFFIGNNPGHPMVVPNKHFENIFDLPESDFQHIAAITKKVALALKNSYNCDGVMLRQNNEPASAQHAFHFHLHIIPRYDNDGLDTEVTMSRRSTPEERLPLALKIKEALKLIIT